MTILKIQNLNTFEQLFSQEAEQVNGGEDFNIISDLLPEFPIPLQLPVPLVPPGNCAADGPGCRQLAL